MKYRDLSLKQETFKYLCKEGDNVIDVNNKDLLKDESIYYKDTISEFDEIFKRAINIKQKIEKEIEKLNN